MFYTLFSLYSMHCDKIVEVKMNPKSCFWSGCWSLLGPRAADLRQNYFDSDREEETPNYSGITFS